jgi:hypothetical protein
MFRVWSGIVAWRAAMDFIAQEGVYCITTGRVVQFSEEEVRQAVREIPSEVIMGEGRDQKVVTRGQLDCKGPLFWRPGHHAPFTEDLAPLVVKNFASIGDPCYLEGFNFPVVDGREIYGLPIEAYAAKREIACDLIRTICRNRAQELGDLEYEETRIGHKQHKADKLVIISEIAIGTKGLSTRCFSGDNGITLEERGAWGVIGVVTPVTQSLPTVAINAVNMIAAGNSLVINPHPNGKKIAALGAKIFNQAIYEKLGIDNLICVITECIEHICPRRRFGEQVSQPFVISRKSDIGFPAIHFDACNRKRTGESKVRAAVLQSVELCVGDVQQRFPPLACR